MSGSDTHLVKDEITRPAVIGKETFTLGTASPQALLTQQKRAVFLSRAGKVLATLYLCRFWKEWKQGVSYATVTRRWDREVCYRIPFKEQAAQTYPLLGTML
jgi:hypothetical protein